MISYENIKFLENKQAATAAINKALDELRDKLNPEDLLVFYLAGHGGPDPNEQKSRYFFTTDFDPTSFKTALSMTLLRDRLTKEINVKRLICFIDTCHSAGFGGEDENKIGMRAIKVNLINQDFTSLLYTSQGTAVLTSSDVNEVSYEDSHWDNHGVFTYYLLKGLKGAADFNGDKIVTVGELFEYTRVEVPKAVSEFIKKVDGSNYGTYVIQHPRAAIGNGESLGLAFIPSVPKNKGFIDK